MAQTTRHQLRTEIRTYLLVSAGAFALGLAIGFVGLGGLS
jgi:hypothetical protein